MSNADYLDPTQEYSSRINRLTKELELIDSKENNIANLRMILFLLGALFAYLGYNKSSLQLNTFWVFFILCIVAFIALVVYHAKILKALNIKKESLKFFEGAINKLKHPEWIGLGTTEDFLGEADHSYALDLNLFGAGGLMDKLTYYTSSLGNKKIVNTLLNLPKVEIAANNTAVIKESKNKIDQRAQFSMVMSKVNINVAEFTQWAALKLSDLKPIKNYLLNPGITFFSIILSIVGVGLTFAWVLQVINGVYVLFALFVNYLFLKLLNKSTHLAIGPLDKSSESIRSLVNAIEQVQSWESDVPVLKEKLNRLKGNDSALDALRNLEKISLWWEARYNQVFYPFILIALLPVHIGRAFVKWHQKHSTKIESWLEDIADIDEWVSFSQFSFDHPKFQFPTLHQSEKAFVKGHKVGHPLLDPKEMITNTISLSDEENSGSPSTWIVSGSNMAGKSTLLRSLGTNVLLARCGLPVLAENFECSALNMAATLHVQDSIGTGRSRFYAELLRLKEVIKLSKTPEPLLFLIDELLSGTNSHDRKIGSDGIMTALINANAVGALTTHDLALTKLADNFPNKIKNVHLQDTLKDGKLYFDYQVQEGVVTKSNAIELMKNVGVLAD